MSLPRVIAVPGFNSSGDYVLPIGCYFRAAGFRYARFAYPRPTPFTILNVAANRFRLRRCADLLGEQIRRAAGEVILLCHSNGLALAWLAHHELASRVRLIVGVQGALDADKVFDSAVINCYHEKDWVLRASRYRPGHIWGDFGARPVEHVHRNVDLRALGRVPASGHSGVWTDPAQVDALWPRIVEIISEAL